MNIKKAFADEKSANAFLQRTGWGFSKAGICEIISQKSSL